MDDRGYPEMLATFEKIWREEMNSNSRSSKSCNLKDWVYDWFLTGYLLNNNTAKKDE